MSNYGHYNAQYYGNKIKFPDESFLIAGISFYQDNLKDINFNSEITMKLEPTNKYDNTAIQIIYNNNKIGYVPNIERIKKICNDNIDNNLKKINIKRESDNKNYGLRVIPDNYYSEEFKNIGIFY